MTVCDRYDESGLGVNATANEMMTMTDDGVDDG